MKMKNKGFSLVELLVAITIAALVAGSVGYLLTTSLRMFGNEATDIAQQQELQTSLNTIIDYAMETQTVVVNNSGTKTNYLALGTVKSSDSSKLDAEIFFTDDQNRLYMCKKVIDDYEKTQDTEPKNLDDKVRAIKADALGDAESLPQYLLAENVTSFYAELNGTKTEDSGKRIYNNPLNLEITLEFSKKSATKEINKKVSDKAVFRNTLHTKIFKNGLDYDDPSKNSLVLSTETVNLEKNAAKIQTPGTEVIPRRNLHILEIVPDYSYDYAQYAIGGYKGDINNYRNVSYGRSSTYGPVTAGELEGFLIQTGGEKGDEIGNLTNKSEDMINSFYPNSSERSDLPSLILTPKVERNGYYEYVGEENGGVYAIDSYLEAGNVTRAGRGNSKPKVKGFTKKYESWGGKDDKNWTEKVFNPVFEYCASEDPSKDYYKAVPTTSGKEEYVLKKALIDGNEVEYYEYVGNEEIEGKVALNFEKSYYRNKQGYDKWNGYCYAVSESHDMVDPNGGEYYAVIDGWESRNLDDPDDAPYEWGYDFDMSVASATMYSKYYPHPDKGREEKDKKAKSADFGWVWHEAEAGSELNYRINKGEYYTPIGKIDLGEKGSGKTYALGTKLYLKNHTRNGLINNDLFKLYVMQDTLEQFVDGDKKMLDVLNGRYDITNNRYSEVNDKAIKNWEDSGNYIQLDVRIPADLSDEDIANCDMVIIGTAGDGGFDFANGWAKLIKNATAETTYSATNDITFHQATEIYKRVCEEEIGIAAPYLLKTVGGSAGTLNMSKMYYMCYCVSNYDLVDSATQRPQIAIEQTVRAAKEKKIEEQGDDNYWTRNPDYMSNIENQVMIKGCGRDFFKDYLITIINENKALSQPLYDNGTLRNKTSDFIYIDANGNIVIPGKNTTITEGGKSYTIRYEDDVKPSFGQGGGSTISDFEYNFLLYGKNNFLYDRYRAHLTGYDQKRNVTDFVYNPKYHLKDSGVEDRKNPKEDDYCGHMYKFYYDDGRASHDGIYRNMLLYNQTSDLFSFSMAGNHGILQLKTINQNSTPAQKIKIPKDVGEIQLVGFSVGEYVENSGGPRDNGRYNLPSDHESMTYSQCKTEKNMFYQHEFENLWIDPIEGKEDERKKVAYISEEELKLAQKYDNGMFVYILVKSDENLYDEMTKENEYNPYLYYNNLQGEKGISEIFPEWPGEAVKYAKEDGKYVTEFRAHIPASYFKAGPEDSAPEFIAPTNEGKNIITAQVGKVDVWTQFEKTEEMHGTITFYICVRDTLDLD
ncbi:MAG: prepilin-type N-terminal cleavage/methylation domain-containing protein [Lachnospiraceae bacterium]|nr:prepilin-type N-terminal cleavage/methylation domain-containing protein [Lachnospiraceae bacterium]